MEKIDIVKLVTDIKECESMKYKWDAYTKDKGLGRQYPNFWYPVHYETHVTSLYTLRAYIRGKMHRKNPPAPIRDFNRTMEELGQPDRLTWDMEKHNKTIAEETAKKYLTENNELNKEENPVIKQSFIQRLFG